MLRSFALGDVKTLGQYLCVTKGFERTTGLYRWTCRTCSYKRHQSVRKFPLNTIAANLTVNFYLSLSFLCCTYPIEDSRAGKLLWQREQWTTNTPADSTTPMWPTLVTAGLKMCPKLCWNSLQSSMLHTQSRSAGQIHRLTTTDSVNRMAELVDRCHSNNGHNNYNGRQDTPGHGWLTGEQLDHALMVIAIIFTIAFFHPRFSRLHQLLNPITGQFPLSERLCPIKQYKFPS